MAKKGAKKTAKKKATRSGEKMGSPPPQRQKRQPGMEREMTPRPKSKATEYLAAGKLKDQVALITGGDSGIGRAVSVAFAKEGADVAILYLNEREDAEETRRLVEEQNRRCLLIEGDVGDSAFCNDAVARTVDEFGRLDILVNNAAEQHVSEFGGNTPMDRPGQPDEVAPAYVFLAGDDSSYTTGQILHVDGGRFVSS